MRELWRRLSGKRPRRQSKVVPLWPLGVFVLSLLVLLAAGCGHFIAPTVTPMATAMPTISPTFSPTATMKLARSTLEPTATATPSPTPVVYVVQKGDTLIGIAHHFQVPVSLLQETNGVSDPRRLQIGQLLVIPPLQAAGGTPPPTPTPMRVVVRNTYWNRRSNGDSWLLGEVVNESGQMVEQVVVGIDLLADDGHSLASRRASVLLEMAAPGEGAPFAVHFPAVPADSASYRACVLSAFPAFVGSAYFDLTAEKICVDNHISHLSRVTGVVVNRGGENATRVQIVVTLFDAESRVIAVRRQPLAVDSLPPGAKEPFEIMLMPLGTPVSRWRVQLVAQKQMSP